MPYRDDEAAQRARVQSLERRAATATDLAGQVAVLQVELGRLRAQNSRLRERLLQVELAQTEQEPSILEATPRVLKRLLALEAAGDWEPAIGLLERIAVRTTRREVQRECRRRIAAIEQVLSRSATEAHVGAGYAERGCLRWQARATLARLDGRLRETGPRVEGASETALSRARTAFRRLKQLEIEDRWDDIVYALDNIARETRDSEIRRECLIRIARIEEEVNGDISSARTAYERLIDIHDGDTYAASNLERLDA